MNVAELERAITQAHDRGDTRELARLQKLFRSSAAVDRISREPVRVFEPARVPVALARAAPSSACKLPVRARVMPLAFSAIDDSLQLTGVETGWWLTGRTVGDTIEVRNAWPPREGSSDVRGGWGWMAHEEAAGWRWDERVSAFGDNVTGIAHTHTGENPDLQPSNADKTAWRAISRTFQRDTLNLIIGAGAGLRTDLSFSMPTFAAFLCRVSDSSVRRIPVTTEEGM